MELPFRKPIVFILISLVILFSLNFLFKIYETADLVSSFEEYRCAGDAPISVRNCDFSSCDEEQIEAWRDYVLYLGNKNCVADKSFRKDSEDVGVEEDMRCTCIQQKVWNLKNDFDFDFGQIQLFPNSDIEDVYGDIVRVSMTVERTSIIPFTSWSVPFSSHIRGSFWLFSNEEVEERELSNFSNFNSKNLFEGLNKLKDIINGYSNFDTFNRIELEFELINSDLRKVELIYNFKGGRLDYIDYKYYLDRNFDNRLNFRKLINDGGDDNYVVYYPGGNSVIRPRDNSKYLVLSGDRFGGTFKNYDILTYDFVFVDSSHFDVDGKFIWVQKALVELNKWDGRVESDPTVKKYLSKYWNAAGSGDLGYSQPWSAAFISYVVPDFSSTAHRIYINSIRSNQKQNWIFLDITYHPLQVGDVLCNFRAGSTTFQGNYMSHCDIVVNIENNIAQVIGGNVGNSVKQFNVRLHSDGRVIQRNNGPFLGILRHTGVEYINLNMGIEHINFKNMDLSPELRITINNLEKITINNENALGYLIKKSNEANIPYEIVLAVITRESRGEQYAISHTGCAGIAQFCYYTALDQFEKPVTLYKQISCRDSNGNPTFSQSKCPDNEINDDRFDPKKSIDAAVKFLKIHYDRYEGNDLLILTAYNAGSGRADACRNNPDLGCILDVVHDRDGPIKANEVKGYIEVIKKNLAILRGE